MTLKTHGSGDAGLTTERNQGVTIRKRVYYRFNPNAQLTFTYDLPMPVTKDTTYIFNLKDADGDCLATEFSSTSYMYDFDVIVSGDNSNGDVKFTYAKLDWPEWGTGRVYEYGRFVKGDNMNNKCGSSSGGEGRSCVTLKSDNTYEFLAFDDDGWEVTKK